MDVGLVATSLRAPDGWTRAQVWTPRASMLTDPDRYQYASAVLNNKNYDLGGKNNDGALRSAEVYDPVSDTWSPLPDMPEARSDQKCVVFNGKIYFIWNVPTLIDSMNHVNWFDPGTNTYGWESNDYSGYNFFDAGVVLNGAMYALHSNQDRLELYKYQPGSLITYPPQGVFPEMTVSSDWVSVVSLIMSLIMAGVPSKW